MDQVEQMDQIDYGRIRQYVEDNIGRGRAGAQIGFFLGNLLFFIVFTLISWLIFMQQGDPSSGPIGAVIMLTLGWLGGLIFHGSSLIFNTRLGEKQLRDSLALRGLQQEMSRLGMSQAELLREAQGEKPKRRSGSDSSGGSLSDLPDELRLGEDGEIDLGTEEDEPQRTRGIASR